MSISALKARSKNSVARMRDAAKKMEKKGYGPDPRLWKPSFDENKNGYAVVRFLPSVSGQEDQPWGQYYSYFFRNGDTGMYYVERSLYTLGQKDPMTALNYKMKQGSEADKAIAAKRKLATKYVANVYVVSDPAKPENEGKVFMWEYGQQIHDIIMSALEPQYPGEPEFDAFDVFDGAHLEIKIRANQGGMPSYDKSAFKPQSVLGTDEEIEKIYAQVHDINDYCYGPSNFKSYEELEERMNVVLGIVPVEDRKALSQTAEAAPIPEVAAPALSDQAIDTGSDDMGFDGDTEDEGEVASYFDSLADED